MSEDRFNIAQVKSSLIKYFNIEGKGEIATLIKKSNLSLEEISYNNWNGGTYIYNLIFETDIEEYISNKSLLELFREEITEAMPLFLRLPLNEHLEEIKIFPKCQHYMNWENLTGNRNKATLLKKIKTITEIMINVSTGNARIENLEKTYKEVYNEVALILNELDVENPNIFKSLWEWYSSWREDDLKTYASRRIFVHGIYRNIINIIENSPEEPFLLKYEPTGWERVDRSIYEMKKILSSSVNEEQFQTIGLIGRETLITIAQQIFDANIHKSLDNITISTTDSKRMLEAFLNYELSGSSNERPRKFAKAAIDLANNLTHNRMATKRDALMCLTSVTAVASIIKSIYENPEIPF